MRKKSLYQADGQVGTLGTAGPAVGLWFRCPRCQRTSRLAVRNGQAVACGNCHWTREGSETDIDREGQPRRCLACGCDDLWRQKNFSQRLGLAAVGLGILLSTIAYATWRPGLALGILMAFGLADCVLFLFMRDVLVCYRCGARHGGFESAEAHGAFDLGVAERYRQEHLRREAAPKSPT